MSDTYEVRPLARPPDADVTVPGSKSLTNRALVAALLAGGTSTLTNVLLADDTEAMLAAVGALGAEVARHGTAVRVAGTSGALRPGPMTIDARQAGTVARFLLPVLALGRGRYRLDADAAMRARPMGPLVDALRGLGVTVEDEGEPGHLPVTVVAEGGVDGGHVRLRGDVSSQFLSGLLLSGPAVPEGLAVTVTTELVSRPYVDLTLAVMRAFGAAVEHHGTGAGETWHVAPQPYRATRYAIEPDASAASYVMAAAVLTGGRVTLHGLTRGALQGDVAFADVLERMGASVTWHHDAVTVAAGERLVGIEVDMEPISDTVPTLAVVAARAEGTTTIRGVGFIRAKESDRLAAPVAELRRCGVDAEATDDGMVIRPAPLQPATFDTYRDHRMAMAFALLGLVAPGMAVRDPGCVAKTFPGYWSLLDDLRSGALAPARRSAG